MSTDIISSNWSQLTTALGHYMQRLDALISLIHDLGEVPPTDSLKSQSKEPQRDTFSINPKLPMTDFSSFWLDMIEYSWKTCRNWLKQPTREVEVGHALPCAARLAWRRTRPPYVDDAWPMACRWQSIPGVWTIPLLVFYSLHMLHDFSQINSDKQW